MIINEIKYYNIIIFLWKKFQHFIFPIVFIFSKTTTLVLVIGTFECPLLVGVSSERIECMACIPFRLGVNRTSRTERKLAKESRSLPTHLHKKTGGLLKRLASFEKNLPSFQLLWDMFPFFSVGIEVTCFPFEQPLLPVAKKLSSLLCTKNNPWLTT